MSSSTSHHAEGRAVTLKDIARHCQVSVATVSRALRDPDFHNADTTRRILTAATEMGYDPAHYQGARRLVLSRFGKRVVNHVIALFSPSFFYRSTFYAEIFEGIWNVLTPEGFGLLLVKADQGDAKPLPASFSRGDVDGVISLTPRFVFQPLLTHLRQNTGYGIRPILTFESTYEDCSAILIDAHTGGLLAAKHLLDLGHRHLLYFTRPDNKSFGGHQDLMLPGYQQAYADAGLDPTRYLHAYELDTKLDQLAFYPAHTVKLLAPEQASWTVRHPLLKLLRATPEITGILAPNDPTALLVRQILSLGKLRVPEDYSLIGFDDTHPLFDGRGANILTTLRVPLEKIGQAAARLIIDRITGKLTENQSLTLPTKLIVRHSTAEPRR